jgi:hypothetical protein
MIDYVLLLYPLTAFIYLRIAVYSIAAWARNGRLPWLLVGVVAATATVDAGWRLVDVAVIAPYWWLMPLVGFALIYVLLKTTRKVWLSLAR